MACETVLKPRQSISQRRAEVRKAVKALEQALAMKTIRPVVGRQGGITFPNWTAIDRDGVSDACAYRMIQMEGGSLARMAIAAAEQAAGRQVSQSAVNGGLHSHDGGKTWDKH